LHSKEASPTAYGQIEGHLREKSRRVGINYGKQRSSSRVGEMGKNNGGE